MSAIGYISDFDGLELIDDTVTVGGVNYKAQSLVGDTSQVISRFRQLANGTVVNYDGTSDADTSPAREVKQKISVSSSPTTYYDTVAAKLGMRGTVTKYKLAGGTETCTGVLNEVKLLERSRPAHGYIWLELIFAMETEWA